MDKTGMESIVNCPECGEQVIVEMLPYQEAISGLMQMLESSMGVGKTEHFEGESKCKCGKKITATLHITASEGGRLCRM